MTQVLLLILATLIWGLGFVATRWTFLEYSPICSNSLRFVFAGKISLVLLTSQFNKFKDKGAVICALLLGIGLQLQTIGIAHTTLAKSGFLTVFYAIFTPILSLLILKTNFRKTYWLLVAITRLQSTVMTCLMMKSISKQ